MREKLLHTPDGVRDIYNSECTKKMNMEERLHHAMMSFGFSDIQTPTFEYFEVFSEERGTVDSKSMYKFFDREGNTLVLRPDMTPSIARCVAKYYKEVTTPIRLCYSGNTFINLSEYQGKLKESTQIGAELVNDSSVQADAEMLALTISALLETGLSEFQVEVGHAGFFKALVAESKLDESDASELKQLIENKNEFGIETFLTDRKLDKKLIKVLCRLGSLKSADRLSDLKALTDNKEALAAVERLEKICELMKAYGFEKYINFDLGALSQYEYYTGIIFHAYTYGTGEAVVSGGRYDKLVATFGKDAPAIGMAVYVDRLMSALARQKLDVLPQPDKSILLYEENCDEEAIRYVGRLRSQGRKVAAIAYPASTILEKKAKEFENDSVAEVLVMLADGNVKRI